MTKRWVALGHRVIVVTTPYDKSDIRANKFIEFQNFDGIEVIVINIWQTNKHSLVKRLINFILFSLVATYYALKIKCDIMIASSGPITIGIPALIAKKIKRISLCFEVRDLWPRGAVELNLLQNSFIIKMAYWFEKSCYKNASLIVACSQGMADDIKHRFGYSNIIVVPNASDMQLFQRKDGFEPPDFAVGKDIFVYAGSIGVMDDCLQIVEAAAVLAKDTFDQAIIVFIGEGNQRPLLQAKILHKNLKNVFFIGLISKIEVARWLSISKASLVVFKDVAVLNTSSPNKLFDSLAAGLPVIQTTTGWIKDMVALHNVGINVSVNDPVQMASAIKELSLNRSLREEQSKNALRLAQQEFSRDKLSNYFLDQMVKLK